MTRPPFAAASAARLALHARWIEANVTQVGDATRAYRAFSHKTASESRSTTLRPALQHSPSAQGDHAMPEAVIVDTIRTPIGRAFKGSLAQLRPEEMGAFVVDQLLERNPDVDPALVEDVICGCGMPQGLRGLQHRPDHLAALREAAADRQRRHRLPLLRLQPRRDPPRRQRDQGRRGRRLHRRRGRVGEPLQRAHRAGRRRRPQPEPDRRERPAQRLHRHGHHRRQRRQQVRRQPRGHGQVRPALAGTGGEIAGRRLLRPRDRPGHAARRHRGRARTTARAPPRPWRSSPNCRRPSAAAASPPATPARSTTAPPRC